MGGCVNIIDLSLGISKRYIIEHQDLYQKLFEILQHDLDNCANYKLLI